MSNALKVVDAGEIPVAPARPRGRPAEELARACVALQTLGIRDREMYSLLFRKTLEENPDFFGVWSVWEPDALDGQDAKFRNAPGHDQSGRFVPFWNRSGDGVRLDPVTGYEYPGPGNWYWLSTSQKQLCVMDPYMYPVAGKRLLLTSQIAPVVMDGQCLGITGVDISVEWFVEHTMKGKAGASLPETNLYEELTERGLVFLNKRGEVRYWTQKTRELLARYLPEPERLLPREVLKAVNASTGAGPVQIHFRHCYSELAVTIIPLRSEALVVASETSYSPCDRACTLTAREREVHHWLSQGKSNEQIAQILGISVHTVKNHLDHIFEKLGVDNRVAAAMACIDRPAAA